MRTVVSWTGLETGTYERCVVEECPSGIRITGRLSGARDLAYDVRLDPGWRFGSLSVAAGNDFLEVARTDGRWTVNGTPRDDLAAAQDIDLAFSPSTNTLPIRRLQLDLSEARDIVTAYISADLAVVPDPQRYTCLDGSTYLYESRDSDFSREVTVDVSGLVVDYPGLFTRAKR